MRSRSNSTIGSILESARRNSRRFSLVPFISNRSESIDLENQIEVNEVNEEMIQIKKECEIRDFRRQRRDIMRTKNLSVSSYHSPTYDSIPYEAMGVVVIAVFICFVIVCLYFAELEIESYNNSAQN